ncbi:MAG: DNA replication and repair protein RecF [Coriobacteriales bacterium]|jgi:DNA replication and repair protein RecF|nr:DNA replication and repair protein RecF [Coriobacteriales bacterium]
MHISRIELTNFRNHHHLVLEDIGGVLIIVGNNAVGKTNIIEALQLISMHESFRKPKPEELVYRERAEGAPTLIKVVIQTLESENTKQLALSCNGKTFSYNKKERPARELAGLLPAVLFTPDDLQIVKGPPEQRRDLLDSLGARLSKSFAQIRAEYYKTLRHKNSLLRQEERDTGLLDSWNVNLAKLGTSLQKHRKGLFEKLFVNATEAYGTLSGGEELSGAYISSWEAEQPEGERVQAAQDTDATRDTSAALYEALLQNQEAELRARRSLVGPHRDDVSFCINGQDTRRFASQGQQRSIALALKMAEIEVLRRVSGKDPLLLLDDVMSELDAARRSYFVELIKEASQTVLTTTNLGYFDAAFLERATVVELEGTASGEGPNALPPTEQAPSPESGVATSGHLLQKDPSEHSARDDGP